ncbi:MAG: hypothetical protein RJA17_364 [Pseudomonadota bacterium]
MLLAWPHVARKNKLLLPHPLLLLLLPQQPPSRSLLMLLRPPLHLLLLLLLPQPSNSALYNKKGKGDLAFFVA